MNKQTPSVPMLMDESAFADAAWDCEQALRAMLGQNINRPVLLEHLRRAFVQGMQRQALCTEQEVLAAFRKDRLSLRDAAKWLTSQQGRVPQESPR